MTTRDVPCNGCTLCCQNDLILLHPECGDDPAQYKTMVVTNPLTGKRGLALQKRSDGGCIYQTAKGCGIHGRAPAICREFDCGLFFEKFQSLPRALRRRYIRSGHIAPEMLKRGEEVQAERARHALLRNL